MARIWWTTPSGGHGRPNIDIRSQGVDILRLDIVIRTQNSHIIWPQKINIWPQNMDTELQNINIQPEFFLLSSDESRGIVLGTFTNPWMIGLWMRIDRRGTCMTSMLATEDSWDRMSTRGQRNTCAKMCSVHLLAGAYYFQRDDHLAVRTWGNTAEYWILLNTGDSPNAQVTTQGTRPKHNTHFPKYDLLLANCVSLESVALGCGH